MAHLIACLDNARELSRNGVLTYEALEGLTKPILTFTVWEVDGEKMLAPVYRVKRENVILLKDAPQASVRSASAQKLRLIHR